MSNIRDSFNEGAGLKKPARKPKPTPDKRKYKERRIVFPSLKVWEKWENIR